MTQTLEQKTEGAKRLLIVEDKLDNLVNGYEAARQRGYEVDVACDLEDALKLIGSKRYDGVITDMCFQEKGLNGESNYDKTLQASYLKFKARVLSEAELAHIPESVRVGWTSAVNKSQIKVEGEKTSAEGFTNQNLREDVVNASILSVDQSLLDAIYLEQSYYFRERKNVSEVNEGIRTFNSTSSGNTLAASNPALGYFIVKEAIKQQIPISIITSTSHADHALPAVLATGLLNREELLSRAKRGVSLKPSDYAFTNWKEWVGFDPVEYGECGGDPNNITEEDIIRNLKRHFPTPYAFRNVILSGSKKEVLDYGFAIDQIEGKIEQTRPYKLA